MKKILLVFMLFGGSIFGQSKGDTQIWIKSTIENFARRDVYNPLLNVYFSDGDIWFVELEDGGSYQRIMPLNKINQVIIKPDANGYVLVLGCTFNESCCRIVRYRLEDGSAKKVNTNEPNRSGVNIYLQKSMGNDNMVARLRKAMTYLIQLNGGKVKSDTF